MQRQAAAGLSAIGVENGLCKTRCRDMWSENVARAEANRMRMRFEEAQTSAGTLEVTFPRCPPSKALMLTVPSQTCNCYQPGTEFCNVGTTFVTRRHVVAHRRCHCGISPCRNWPYNPTDAAHSNDLVVCAISLLCSPRKSSTSPTKSSMPHHVHNTHIPTSLT